MDTDFLEKALTVTVNREDKVKGEFGVKSESQSGTVTSVVLQKLNYSNNTVTRQRKAHLHKIIA